jgi:hypothetical protein
MKQKIWIPAALAGGMVLLSLIAGCASGGLMGGNGNGNTDRFTAFAVNLGSRGPISGSSAGTVEIAINRWSSDQETESLVGAFRNGGADTLLSALRENPSVGYIRTPDRVGWQLHYAREIPTDDGGRRIFLATDRPIGFWEAVNQTRSLDYPFTLIELRLGPDGRGEGRMSIATRITESPDHKYLQLENYLSEPVRLQEVREQG